MFYAQGQSSTKTETSSNIRAKREKQEGRKGEVAPIEPTQYCRSSSTVSGSFVGDVTNDNDFLPLNEAVRRSI